MSAGRRAALAGATAVALLSTPSCVATWHRDLSRLESEAASTRTDVAAIGEGRRVVGDDLRALRVETTPFCRERVTRDVRLVRVEHHTANDVTTLPWLGTIGLVFYTIYAGVPLALSDDVHDADVERALLGGAFVVTPLLLGLALAPPGNEVTVRRPEGEATDVAWTGPPSACAADAWTPAAGVELALEVRQGVEPTQTAVVARAVRTTSTGAAPDDVAEAFAGLLGWCGDLHVVASSGDRTPDVDPGAPAPAAWSTGTTTLTLASKEKATLARLATLDPELGVFARRCCEQHASTDTEASCRDRCAARVDVGARLACENTCRVERIAEVCR